jgi:hypothetical protein
MKYQDLLKIVKRAQEVTKQDGIPSYFYRSNGKLELTYPALALPDNNVSFRQLCRLENAGFVEFSGIDETVYITTI